MGVGMAADDDHLNKARLYVEEAQRLVWEQKGRIARLRAAGFDTLSAEQILRLLEANLKGTSNNCHRSSGAPNLPANDSALFSFRFCVVHPKDVRDSQLRQLFEVPSRLSRSTDAPWSLKTISISRALFKRAAFNSIPNIFPSLYTSCRIKPSGLARVLVRIAANHAGACCWGRILPCDNDGCKNAPRAIIPDHAKLKRPRSKVRRSGPLERSGRHKTMKLTVSQKGLKRLEGRGLEPRHGFWKGFWKGREGGGAWLSRGRGLVAELVDRPTKKPQPLRRRGLKELMEKRPAGIQPQGIRLSASWPWCKNGLRVQLVPLRK
jgi:hypothetical protein